MHCRVRTYLGISSDVKIDYVKNYVKKTNVSNLLNYAVCTKIDKPYTVAACWSKLSIPSNFFVSLVFWYVHHLLHWLNVHVDF